jgi:hypothetical protein
MKLSAEEKELILKKRQAKETDKPQKTAVAKTDIWVGDTTSWRLNEWVFTPEEKDQQLEEIIDNLFTLAIKKGESFTCFINEDGEEEWYDDVGYGIECMDAKWAEKYLTNIRPIKKGKNR